MKVRYTETALEEIEDILSRISVENSSAALKVSGAILATIDRVAEFPRTAGETNAPGVKMTPVLPYRYLVFVSIDDDTSIVRNVRHSARQHPDFPRS
jgi:plasmid stabilization system protein ParE